MSQDRKNQQQNDPQRADIARRDFVALSMGASLGAAAGAAAARELDVVETDLESRLPTVLAMPHLFTLGTALTPAC